MTRAILLVCALGWAASAEVKLLRHPTYHKGRVAFSYLGDVWAANENGTDPQRLTVHKSRDVYPRFSPDGRWIAFSSNRYGNYDVFLMPAAGGQPRRLTFHSGADTVVGWTPDSKRVLFQASRGLLFSGVPNLYEVSVDGGLEQPLPTDWGYWGSYSPDGSKLAFNRHGMPWWRKHYRGSRANDVWVMDVASKSFRRLDADSRVNSAWPLYAASGDIYFVSDRLPNEKTVKPGAPEVLQSANNLWKIPERGGAPVQATHHKSGSVFFPSISGDGRVIVYEADFGLWKLDTTTGKTVEIKLSIPSDEKENNVETLSVQNEADGFSLSPSGRRAAVSTHGEIFTVATERGDLLRVTESFSRETNPQWSPDGKWITFVSDRSGRDEVWIADERGQNLRKLSDLDTEKTALEWAPDSKSLLYASSDHKLYRAEIEGGKTDVVATSEVSAITGPRFSPDGRWISYGKLTRDMRPHVYIVAAAGGAERHLGGEELFSETGARWTPDGKKLIFLSGVAQQGMAQTSQNVMQLYSVSLQKEDKPPAERGVDSEAEAQAAPETPARGARPGPAGAAAAEARKVEVQIDFDGLDRRARRLTRLSGNVVSAVPAPDSRSYAFVALAEQEGRTSSALYTISEDGDRLNRLTQSQPPAAGDEPPTPRGGFFGGGISTPQYARDGRTIYFLERDGIWAVPSGSGGPAEGAAASASPAPPALGARGGGPERRRVTFTARVEVDHRAEWKQVFHESWRVMKNRFYDSKMHGVDWARMRTVYEPLLEHIADQEEMHNVVLQMIGELNASHTGISPATTPADRQAAQTRYPGFEIEPDPSGRYRVSRIYKNGPANKDYVKLAPGDFVLAVNDQELKTPENYWKYYNSLPGRRFEFTVNSKPTLEGAWKIKVEPVSATQHATLLYEKWVAERKAMVEEIGAGDIGYLHIRAMNVESLRKFERDLVENRFKQALIIDQRFNGGGGIDQELLQILIQKPYQTTRGRDSVEVSRPQRAFFGPMVVMANENSGSDAEMFPDGFRALGLGKVVGVPTYGAVIGTGAYRLMDGSSIRTPGSGVWSIKGYNLENYGVPPDVYVDNGPEDFLRGRDAQIQKAVEVLKEDLRRKK